MRHSTRGRTSRFLAVAAAAGLALGLAGTAAADPPSTGFATSAAAYDLLAGQDELAGQVFVWDFDGDVYVQYVANHGWCITETHVEVAGDEPGIPQTNKGNPIPGQFSQGETFSECATLAGHYIFPDAFSEGDDVVVAAHAAMRETIVEGPSWATTVESSDQGVRKDGTAVLDERSDGMEGLIADYQQGGDTTFFSLGFKGDPLGPEPGGELAVGFDCKVVNGPGDDLQVYEVTNGVYPLETAAVYASMDGVDWMELGTADNSIPVPGNPAQRVSAFDLGELPYATHVKLVDTTDPTLAGFPGNADGFDVDGVEALQDCVEFESAWGDGDRFVDRGNWATYSTYTQGDGTVVNSTGEELTFLVFDLGDPAADLGGMAWLDGPQEYAAHTICVEVSGDEAWFTYQIPPGQNAAGQYVTFRVTAGEDGPIDYAFSPSMTAMVDLCVNQSPITGGYQGTPTSGNVIVHPGA